MPRNHILCNDYFLRESSILRNGLISCSFFLRLEWNKQTHVSFRPFLRAQPCLIHGRQFLSLRQVESVIPHAGGKGIDVQHMLPRSKLRLCHRHPPVDLLRLVPPQTALSINLFQGNPLPVKSNGKESLLPHIEL